MIYLVLCITASITISTRVDKESSFGKTHKLIIVKISITNKTIVSFNQTKFEPRWEVPILRTKFQYCIVLSLLLKLLVTQNTRPIIDFKGLTICTLYLADLKTVDFIKTSRTRVGDP